MAKRTSNTQRFDPYKNFKFRLLWDGRYIAGVSRVSALIRTTEVVEAREGSGAATTRRLPGRTKYEAITLERGVSHDTAFEQWANAVAGSGSGSSRARSAAGIRKDIVIELYDEKGRLVIAYKVFRCWVSEYQALPELDANANAVLIEHLKLENEGWERDTTVAAPTKGATRRA